MLTALAAVAIAQTGTIELRECLAITAPGNSRTPVRIDPIEAQMITTPNWAPAEGAKVGERTWSKVAASANGQFQGPAFRGGYAYITVNADSDKTMILEANGGSSVYVNGEPRVGDPYQFGNLSIPVRLKTGANSFLFQCGRGSLAARLREPKAEVEFDLRDATTPDALEGRKEKAWAGLILLNNTAAAQNDLTIEAVSSKGAKTTTKVWPIGRTTLRKVGVELNLDGGDAYTLTLKRGSKTIDTATLPIRVRKPNQCFKVTFLSQVDGSVQYYGVNPSSTPGNGQALFLSLHGASVEAIGQAEAYGQKSWGTLVAATNRRPYGFDWEDIGRLDALEVLEHARKRFRPDPAQVYLTGHSMGGHGTWQVGVHFPDKFAAIAPSAGWTSFWSYAGGANYPNPGPMESMILRAMSPSDTLKLKTNFGQLGVFVVHGDADDNVPVGQARTMKTELADVCKDFGYHEQPGAGHWWDDSDAPGAACVDFPGAFEMFKRRRIPLLKDVSEIDFATSSPGVSATNHWATIVSQPKPWVVSRIQLKADRNSRTISGRTNNVNRLELRLDSLRYGDTVSFSLDGDEPTVTAWPRGDVLRLERNHKWSVVRSFSVDDKNPVRYGGFKDVYKNRVVFVYGTKGGAEENAWAYAKARYDAETLGYRGNGSVDVIADVDFKPADFRGRNLVIFGSKSTNAAYDRVVDAPMVCSSGVVGIGDRTVNRPDLGVMFVCRRKGDAKASVGVVAGTGIVGMRLLDRAPVFLSGASMPDLLVYTPRALTDGVKGMLAAGYFGRDWSVAKGEVVWNEP